jgi:predicted PurR-regulated permease PerM
LGYPSEQAIRLALETILTERSALVGVIQRPATTLINLAVAALIVTGLYFGREILVPVALAILLSFVLSPFVTRLQSWRIPRIASVLFVVFIGFSIIFSLGGLMVSQANRLAGELPSYRQTLQEKIQSLRGAAAGSGTLEKASKVLKDLNTELQNPETGNRSSNHTLTEPSDKPIPVEVKLPDPGTLTTLVAIIGPLIQPLTTTGIVVIFVAFILLQRQDLRNRFIRLAGSQDIQRTTAALDEAGQRLSKLFLVQLAFNATFGLLIGAGLELIGVPSAPLWGLIAMIMRFVPYIGALLSAIFPMILAAAVGSGWEMLLWTAALFATLELFAGQVIEPLVYGHSSGLSPVAIIVSASFWTWLWGPVGLVLATPLTICLVVVGRHVDRLRFLEIMLGDQPSLTPAQLVYQRMLAGDPMEASEQARNYLKDASLEDYYDTILLSGLRLAEADDQLGKLDDERTDRILSTVNEMVDDLETHEDQAIAVVTLPNTESSVAKLTTSEPIENSVLIPQSLMSPSAVLCIPGEGKLDEAAALVLAQVLRRQGVGAVAESAGALSMSKFFALDLSAVSRICVCYVNHPSNAKVHYAVRRLNKKHKEGSVLIALLGEDESTKGGAIGSVANATLMEGRFGFIAKSIIKSAANSPTDTRATAVDHTFAVPSV